MSSMRAYLAEKYMSGPKADAILARTAPQKKKKRKGAASQPISNVRDDDAEWTDQGKEDDDIAEAVIASDRGFKKRRVTAVEEESGWTTVQEPEPPSTPPPLADEQPLLVESAPAFVGGLMTSEQLLGRLPQENLPADLSVEAMAAAQETVYRDTSGRKIDTKAERAEAARRKREAEEREAQKMEWGKGLVQREEQEQRKLELEKQKTTKFARHVDDKELNEEMRSREHWNDPAAAFLTVRSPV
jgi:pre-mRNA-splicing factor CWC26